MILKTSYQEIQCNISSYLMTPVTMGHRMSPDFPTEHKLNAPNTPRISGSTKSRQSMPASVDKNIWHHDTPCHENATYLGSAFEEPGHIPPSPRPKEIFESDSQSISKRQLPKTYQNNYTSHRNTSGGNHQKKKKKKNTSKHLLSKLGTETGWNVRPWHRRFLQPCHHQWSQPGPPGSPKIFGQDFVACGLWACNQLYHDGR